MELPAPFSESREPFLWPFDDSDGVPEVKSKLSCHSDSLRFGHANQMSSNPNDTRSMLFFFDLIKSNFDGIEFN